jgi:hypothetical protein
MRLLSSTFFAFLTCALLISITTNAAEPPNGFRTFKWGSPPTAGLKKLSDSPDGITIYVPLAGKNLPPLFDLPVTEEMYMFANGKFYSGSSYIDGEANFQKMKAVLTKSYGPPTFVNENLHIWKWQWPKSAVEVDLSYQPKFTRTTVTFANNSV